MLTFWMGYDHIGHPKGDFKYAYTGKMSPFDKSEHPNLSDGVDGDCARIRWNQGVGAADVDDIECSSVYASVCEINDFPGEL